MSARQLTLTMPMPVNRGNARMHWRPTLRAKKHYFADCDQRQLIGMIPPPPPTPFGRCVLNATMVLGQAMDDDNAMARLKYALDWIRTRGYVRDDSRRVIQWAGFPRQIVDRTRIACVELRLTELAALEP